MLDLVYNELDKALEVQTRAHIENCEDCRLSYLKLNQAVSFANQLPQLEPPDGLNEKIMAAVYRKLDDRSREDAGKRGSIRDNTRNLVGFISRLAMGRQVAMATVMLLIVAFGIHFLPYLRPKPEATGGIVVNSNASGETGPSSELTPAEPFDLTMDLPRGRIRSKEAVENEKQKKESLFNDQQAASRLVAASNDESDKPSESPESLYRRGIASYRAGNYTIAISDLNRVANQRDEDGHRATALLYIARSYRATERCLLAIPRYKTLVEEYPDHDQSGSAMLEAARCLRRLDKIAEAREMLERASRYPSVAEQAERELVSLE